MSRLATCLAVLALAAPAAAQMSMSRPAGEAGAGQPVPPLDELVALGVARSPRLAALAARVDAARSAARAAGALANPSLDVQWMNPVGVAGADGVADEAWLMLRQPLPGPGKRSAARRAAEAEIAVAGAQLELARRDLAAEIRSAYADLWATDVETHALGEAHEVLDLLARSVRARWSAGQGSAATAIAAELARAEHDLDVEQALARRAEGAAELRRLVSDPSPRTLATLTGIELPAVAFPAPPWSDLAAPESPALADRARAVDAAERRLDAARLGTRPDLSLGGGVDWMSGARPAPMLLLGIDLPWRKRAAIQPRIDQAAAELDAERWDLVAAERALAGELEGLEARWRGLESRRVRLAEAVVPEAAVAFEAAQTALATGDSSFAEALERFKDWMHARIELARTEAERYAVWARLQALLPVPPANVKENS
ncbi:MAG: TolC family protein [Thermoanaerobaculia bacterium]